LKFSRSLLPWLNQPVDAAGLAAFRLLFGGLMLASVARFALRGWIREFYLAPVFHFTYFGFEWVKPLPAVCMYGLFTLMGLAATGILVGFRTRLSAALFCVTFSYAELIDKTVYLNHYYFVSLLALLLAIVPSSGRWSLDARRKGRQEFVRNWAYLLLRVQVALVYIFAGLAKLNSDWLWHAEPLARWLQARSDVPLIGSYLTQSWVAFFMSWAGACFDLLIVPALLWARTRWLAFAFAVLFHVSIWILFPIGVFSWVMLTAATLLLPFDWPRSLMAKFGLQNARVGETPANLPRLSAVCAVMLSVWVAVQVALPLRHLAYPGWVNWTEQGFRFAWRVMLIEKTGEVEYLVVTHDPERRRVIFPRRELTPLQYKMMATDPDMIHEYARHLAKRFEEQGKRSPEVYARGWVSLNGRSSQRLVDPNVNLAAEKRSIWPKTWIVPLRAGSVPN
jgi:hypothetical protein